LVNTPFLFAIVIFVKHYLKRGIGDDCSNAVPRMLAVEFASEAY
jgi:hypothetical protein